MTLASRMATIVVGEGAPHAAQPAFVADETETGESDSAKQRYARSRDTVAQNGKVLGVQIDHLVERLHVKPDWHRKRLQRARRRCLSPQALMQPKPGLDGLIELTVVS